MMTTHTDSGWVLEVAVLLMLFAAGHTFGFLLFKPATPEGVEVHNAMNSVRFEFKGSNYSYGGLYKGFGLIVAAYLLFSAVLAWQLGNGAA